MASIPANPNPNSPSTAVEMTPPPLEDVPVPVGEAVPWVDEGEPEPVLELGGG
jgi:hypothetical protein